MIFTINEFHRTRGYMKKAAIDNEELDVLVDVLLDIGEAMIVSGAEIMRVEDTVCRIGYAYGAQKMNVFAITSDLVVTAKLNDQRSSTQSRRIREAGTINLTRLERMNSLSRQVCVSPVPVASLRRLAQDIIRQKNSLWFWLTGSALASGALTIFFGGRLVDGIVAAAFGVLVFWLQRYVAPICMNAVIFQLLASFLTGVGIGAVDRIFPFLQGDYILVGTIMLLIPGVAFTNSFRDLLLGDTISGALRLIEALVLAVILAFGFMGSMFMLNAIA